ncbi:MAG: helix-turn-helix transcriptional regulator [Phycisphaerae bacterium]
MPKQLSFADMIRRAFKKSGMSVYRLAKDSGLCIAPVQRFVAGEADVTLRSAERLCRALNLELRTKR